MLSQRNRAGILYFLFFLSGLASLADEVVWFKYLNLTFGATTSATAILLAVFMGGLAAGSALLARLAVRLERPALVYGALEAGVGLFALATPILFSGIDAGYVFAFRHIGNGPGTLLATRAVLSTAALLVPTILMGATFPVLARELERADAPGRRSARLYGVNTGGAVTGVVLCGFVAIPRFGLHATLALSACVSLAAALAATLLPRSPKENARAAAAWPDKRWLAVAAVTGAGAMADEVVWTRALVLHTGSTVYAFAMMLSIYLAGLVAGSLVGSALSSRNPRRSLAFAQAGLAAVLIAQVFAFTVFKDVLVKVGIGLVHAQNYSGLLATQAISTGLYLLAPTFLMGMTFSLLLKAASPSEGGAPGSAGGIYAANTLGGIAGALLAGFAAIPAAGSQNTLIATALAASAVSVCLVPARAGLWIVLAALCGLSMLARPDALILSAGVLSNVPAHDLIYYKEDAASTVAVKRYEGPPPFMSLELNGVNVAGTSPDLVVIQKLQGHLPLSFVSNPKSVVHIGLGSGGTAYAVSLHPVDRIEIVEISPGVVRAARRFFDGVNHGVLADPRVSIHINDGRNFILASPETFDAILSDSIHPRYAGNGSLYTEDYFRLCRARLAPGGVISMWLPMYTLLPENYRAIVRAFRDVFPNVSIWYAHSVENPFTIVLATPEKTVRLEGFRRQFDDARVRADLERIGAADPADVLSYLLLAPDDVTRWVARTAPHVDDEPKIEYQSGWILEYFRPWYATFADLCTRRSRIEDFVTGLRPGDPLSDRIRTRYAQSRAVLERHLASLGARLATAR